MNNSPGMLFYTVLSNLFGQVPMIVVSLVGVVVSTVRWRDAPAPSRWTLAASLLSLGVCLGAAASQTWMTAAYSYGWTSYAPSSSMVSRSWLFGGIGLFWATLRAIATGLLLAGVYAGRGAPAVPASTPLPLPPDFPPTPNR